MVNWWERWFGKSNLGPEYDRFVSDFAKKFEKEHGDLLQSDLLEYWKLFRQKKEQAWLEYRMKYR
jgi:hypothetical protein